MSSRDQEGDDATQLPAVDSGQIIVGRPSRALNISLDCAAPHQRSWSFALHEDKIGIAGEARSVSYATALGKATVASQQQEKV